MANTLIALRNLVTNQNRAIQDHYQNNNRANAMGDALETYIKDLYAGSFDQTSAESLNSYNKVFSYLGNKNNPPDAMLRGGDAIEIKKIESPGAGLALNSSPPKSKLHSDSLLITNACKDCEEWDEKDIVYYVGYVRQNKLKYLWIVYGDCYAADRDIYNRIRETISDGIETIPNVEFSETKELGRVNKVDPLGITYLRIRGMWGIINPNVVFRDFGHYDVNKPFQFFCIMQKTKYESFSLEDRNFLENHNNVETTSCSIQDPNNPANLMNAVFINNRV